jgi:hypothetical protein
VRWTSAGETQRSDNSSLQNETLGRRAAAASLWNLSGRERALYYPASGRRPLSGCIPCEEGEKGGER